MTAEGLILCAIALAGFALIVAGFILRPHFPYLVCTSQKETGLSDKVSSQTSSPVVPELRADPKYVGRKLVS